MECRRASDWEDHPRLCGDHHFLHLLSAVLLGSPPLMRGPPRRRDDRKPRPGITPAYAGTTYLKRSAFPPRWDHPRLCGDHYRPYCMAVAREGSPPLMRGPPISKDANGEIQRITPAYAGTTHGRGHESDNGEDHPRLCGDHNVCFAVQLYLPGSPPLMRGPQRTEGYNGHYNGITPAYAGTTCITI